MSNTTQWKNAFAIAFSLANLPALALIALVQTAFGGSFEDHLGRQIEFIFAQFGLTGENVVSTQVSNVRVMDDDYTTIISKVALIHQDTQLNIIDIMQANILRVRVRFNQYFDYGKRTYVHGLPTSSLTADIIPTADIINTINAQYGVNSQIVSSRIDTPTKNQWVWHKLKDLYGFNLRTNTMTYLTFIYKIDYSEYNFTTAKYDVHVYRQATVTTTTTISVVAIDATNETKRTVVKVEKQVAEGLYSTTSTTTDVVVAAGSTVASTVVAITEEKLEPKIIPIDAFSLAKYFVVNWSPVGSTDTHYWTYLMGSGNVALDKGLVTAELDMLPIIAIRNNGVNLNANLLSQEYLQSKEMLDVVGMDIETLTTTMATNPDIASIMDVFVYFGLDVSDTSPTVAKYLFYVFDYVLTKSNSAPIEATYVDGYTTQVDEYGEPIETENASTPNLYNITVREGVYNSAVAWSYQTRNVITGVLGPIGTCSSSIVGADLIVRSQITEGQYLEYRIVQLSVISVVTRGGLSAAVTKTLLDGPVVLPMCYNIIDGFTTLEQVELFAKGLRLAVYSALITHLNYYQTPDFAAALKISIIVASIVFTILFPPSGPLWMILLKAVAVYALLWLAKELIAMVDNPILKGILIAAIVAVSIYFGDVTSLQQAGVLTADLISTAVTQWTDMRLEDLQAEAESFYNRAEEVFKEIADKTAAFADTLETEFVAMLAVKEVEPAFIRGTSLTFYQAVQMQHDHVYLSVGRAYNEIPTYYEKAFLLGVV